MLCRGPPLSLGFTGGILKDMVLQGKERRKYYRHPISAPIKLRATSNPDSIRAQTEEVSLGGLSFLSQNRLEKGSFVDLSIPVKDKLFEIKGRVTYCVEQSKGGRFRTGILFLDSPSAFRAKLAEEALEILRYRKDISRERGEEVSEEEAARQWIQRFAENFPNLS